MHNSYRSRNWKWDAWIIIFQKVTYSSFRLNLLACEYALGILSLIKWIDRFGTQQRLSHQVYLLATRRVDYMRRCMLLGREKKGNLGAVGWCCWCCLLVRKEGRLVKLVLFVVCCCLFIMVTRVTFPSFAAPLCCLLALAGVHKLVILAGEFWHLT